MKHLILSTVFLLFFSLNYAQNDLQNQNLYSKVKTIKKVFNHSKYEYSIDSFDTDGYLLKSEDVFDKGDGKYNPQENSGFIKVIYNNTHQLIHSATYDSNGNITDSITCKYNQNHLLIEKINASNLYDIKNEYTYDNDNRCVSEKITKYYKSQNNQDIVEQTLFYKYNTNKQLIEVNSDHLISEENSGSIPVFYGGYDYFGFFVEGTFTGKAIIKYDSENSLIEQDVFDYSGLFSGKVTCKYDKYHNITNTSVFGKKGKVIFSTPIKYTYDHRNNWITKNDGQTFISRKINYY